MKVAVTEVLTVGHSTHSWDQFVALLRAAEVTAICDVRSSPYSRTHPQFGRENMRAELKRNGIAYVFLGSELGGRPRAPDLFRNGVADYEKMARTKEFCQGLDRVIEGSKKYRIALLCSEQDPLDCHRCLLVARALRDFGVQIGHILRNGTVVSHDVIENQLLDLARREDEDLFASRSERLTMAYRAHARKVAFSERQQPADESVKSEEKL